MKTPSCMRLWLTPALLLSTLCAAQAQSSILYNGGNNSSWNTDSNWAGGTKPLLQQIASLNGNSGGSAANGVIMVDSHAEAGRISFSGSLAKTITINSGVNFTLYGIGTPNIIFSHVANSNLTVNGAGKLVLANSGTFYIQNASRTLSVASEITESGGARQIIKTGAGTLQLTNLATNSTFSGGIRVSEGALTTNVSSTGSSNAPTQGPLGLGSLYLENGTQFNYTGSTAGTIHNRVVIEGNVTLGLETLTRGVTLAGNIDLTGSERTLQISQQVTLSGAITNGGLTKTGSKELELTGASTYTGATRIREGTLTLKDAGTFSASKEIEIASGATWHIANNYALSTQQAVKGQGTISGHFRSGEGVIQPGDDGIGTLAIEGDATFTGGQFVFELAATEHDQILFSGDGFTLTGNTSGGVKIHLIDFDGSAAEGSYLLFSTAQATNTSFIDWDLSAFTLEPLPSHWSGQLRMGAEGLYFDLHAIPEPSTYLLLTSVGAALYVFRRRAL